MSVYIIWVNGLLHHATTHQEDHETYAAQLTEAGHDVTTEVRS